MVDLATIERNGHGPARGKVDLSGLYRSDPGAALAEDDPYLAFLREKAALAPAGGFDVSNEEIHPYLAPHARAAVRWAVAGGRRALFEGYWRDTSAYVEGAEMSRLTPSLFDLMDAEAEEDTAEDVPDAICEEAVV